MPAEQGLRVSVGEEPVGIGRKRVGRVPAGEGQQDARPEKADTQHRLHDYADRLD